MQRWYYIVIGTILLGGAVYMYIDRVDLGLVPGSSLSSARRATSSGTSSAAGTLGGTASGSAIGSAGGTVTGIGKDALKPPHITWTPIHRSEEGFEVELPGDTKEIQIPAYNENGGTDHVDMLYAYPDANTSFSLAWADEPPVERASGNSADKTLDAAVDDALARTQSTLVSESKDDRLGLPARDFVGRNAGGGLMNARLILAGRRLYMLIAAFPAASARRDEDVNHFFDSFRITAKN